MTMPRKSSRVFRYKRIHASALVPPAVPLLPTLEPQPVASRYRMRDVPRLRLKQPRTLSTDDADPCEAAITRKSAALAFRPHTLPSQVPSSGTCRLAMTNLLLLQLFSRTPQRCLVILAQMRSIPVTMTPWLALLSNTSPAPFPVPMAHSNAGNLQTCIHPSSTHLLCTRLPCQSAALRMLVRPHAASRVAHPSVVIVEAQR